MLDLQVRRGEDRDKNLEGSPMMVVGGGGDIAWVTEFDPDERLEARDFVDP